MRNILFSITLFLFLIPSVRAQEKLDFDPDLAWNTLRAEYGAVIPVGTVSNKSFGDGVSGCNMLHLKLR